MVYLRQMTHAAGDHDVTLVFDCPCLCTALHAQKRVFCIRPDRHKQDVHPRKRLKAGQLWKLNVIADQDPDSPSISLDCLQPLSATDHPIAAFIRRDMQLVLTVHAAVALTEVGDIEQLAVFHHGQTATNDIHVIADGEGL